MLNVKNTHFLVVLSQNTAIVMFRFKGRHGSEKFTNTYTVHGLGIMIYFKGLNFKK